MPITHNENFMAVFDDPSEVTVTWNCNRHEIFEIILGGTTGDLLFCTVLVT